MREQFHSIGSNPSYTCCICLQKSEEDLQTHNDLHAMHKECIKVWAKNHSTCPVCRTDVDSSSLFSWKERIIHRLENVNIKNIIVNALPNYPSAYIGAYMANSSLGRTRAEEPPLSTVVLLVASAIGALVATQLHSARYSAQKHASLINTYAIVYVISRL
ncbi:MAG TPA: RING finger domain-containing protein [Rhabdochlamydiaceae bacterium]|nr:RING finger domain-containing protein [Rhabdochlamydiaceae bacterium]